jgi:hypothetical protein
LAEYVFLFPDIFLAFRRTWLPFDLSSLAIVVVVVVVVVVADDAGFERRCCRSVVTTISSWSSVHKNCIIEIGGGTI